MSTTPISPKFLPSPSSPSESDFKYRSRSAWSIQTPYSPVSPSLMSVATKSYVSPYGNHQHTDEMAQRQAPSSADNYKQPNQRMNTMQEGSLKRSNEDDDGQHRDKRQRVDVPYPDRMEVESGMVPTNHERQDEASGNSGQTASSKPNPPTRDDFAEPFLLCKSSVSRSNPDPQQHLLATYGLLPLLKTVARNDPETGEKINKLRKSYEGQIKMFGLAGRNKPVKCEREEDEPGPLRRLATISEQEWKEGPGQSKIEVTTDFRAKLTAAMQLQPGTVRNNAMWEDLLGHEKSKPVATPTPSQVPTAPRIPNGGSRQPQAVTIDKRATRHKKRSYRDDSFDGYGEGFSEGDDDGDEDDYTKRKRKKDSFNVSASYHNGR